MYFIVKNFDINRPMRIAKNVKRSPIPVSIPGIATNRCLLKPFAYEIDSLYTSAAEHEDHTCSLSLKSSDSQADSLRINFVLNECHGKDINWLSSNILSR